MHMPIRLVNGHQTYSGKCTHVYHPLSIMSITSLKAQYIHKLHYRHLEMLFAQHYVGCTITKGSGIMFGFTNLPRSTRLLVMDMVRRRGEGKLFPTGGIEDK